MRKLIGQRLAGAAVRPLDGLADALQPRLQKILGSSLALRNLLDGTWLGVPLHPAVADVPVGASTTALMLDLGAVIGRSNDLARGADRALAVAVLGTMPAALTGAADWRALEGETRRVGAVHALANTVALTLNIGSLLLRAHGRRGSARFASFSAVLVTSVAAHVGGELSYGLGVRVNPTAWETPPDEFTAVAAAGEIDDQGLHRVELAGAPVLITRSTAGALCAIAATCTHLGGPLDEGARDGDSVSCPWHASRFDLRTGEVIDGPAVFAQPCYEVRERDGKIELRAPGRAA